MACSSLVSLSCASSVALRAPLAALPRRRYKSSEQACAAELMMRLPFITARATPSQSSSPCLPLYEKCPPPPSKPSHAHEFLQEPPLEMDLPSNADTIADTNPPAVLSRVARVLTIILALLCVAGLVYLLWQQPVAVYTLSVSTNT